MDKIQRDQLLRAEDEYLLAKCRIDRMRGSGRGGQKRNVTNSAVRITHEASGISAGSDVSRSQHRNRRDALRRLREEIALNVRCVPPEVWEWTGAPSHRSERYPLWVAELLDVLHAAGYGVADAAAQIGCSTGQLVRAAADFPEVWQKINEERQARNLKTLKSPG